jgi:hypothetical protein
MHRLRLRHVRVSVVNRPGCIVASFRGLAKPLLAVRLTLYPVRGPEEGARARGGADPQPPSNRQPPAASRVGTAAPRCEETLSKPALP